MSIQVPADSFLLRQTHCDAEKELIESVRRRTREDMARKKVEEFRIEARAGRIARNTFNSEYEPFLAKTLPRQLDRELLVAIHEGKLIGRLIEESLSVYRSGRGVVE
jgi:hypothetical protein